MLVIGAKGCAGIVLEVLFQNNKIEKLAFYDDISTDLPEKLFGRFEIINNLVDAETFLKEDEYAFTLAIGNPVFRKQLYEKFKSIGGIFTSTISPKADIGHFNTTVSEGCNIMSGVVISNNVFINIGALINLNVTVGHDSKVGKFVEISPGAQISGNCTIGDFTYIGSNATILPRITIGSNVIVAAGAVVTQNVPDNCMVAGVPAVIKKERVPLSF